MTSGRPEKAASAATFLQAPLLGKMSVSRVFWLYGIVGSLIYGSIELFLNPENAIAMRLYTIGGFLYTVYVIVGTYRCAVNCKTPQMASFVRISCLVSLGLLPVLTYFELTGALSLSSLAELQQLNL